MSSDRIAVEGRPGIWCRKTDEGRVRFEVAIEEGTTGTTRWLTVAGGLARAEAALAALERRAAVTSGQPQLTVATMAERWLDEVELSPRTREAYEWALYVHLLPRLGDLPIGDLGEWHAIALLDELKEAGYERWTLEAVVAPLNAVAAHAVELGMLPSNPFAFAMEECVHDPEPRRGDDFGARVVSLRRYRSGQAVT